MYNNFFLLQNQDNVGYFVTIEQWTLYWQAITIRHTSGSTFQNHLTVYRRRQFLKNQNQPFYPLKYGRDWTCYQNIFKWHDLTTAWNIVSNEYSCRDRPAAWGSPVQVGSMLVTCCVAWSIFLTKLPEKRHCWILVGNMTLNHSNNPILQSKKLGFVVFSSGDFFLLGESSIPLEKNGHERRRFAAYTDNSKDRFILLANFH